MPHVLHVMGFPPNRVGGTEIYVADLAKALIDHGFTSTIVAPAGPQPILEHAGVPVETYPVNDQPEEGEMRLNRPHLGFDAFETILSRYPDAIYHQHSWTRGCGGPHLRAARLLKMSTVLTMHVAGNLCLRGDMMRFGTAPCDGLIDTQVCAACWSTSKGLPSTLAGPLSHLPLPVARAARRGSGRLASALSARAIVEEKARSARAMIADSDRLVALCDWTRDAILLNGAPGSKVVLSRQGVSEGFDRLATPAQRPGNQRTSLLYLGSWNPLKGVDVAVRAVLALPADLDLTLTIQAPSGEGEALAYERQVRALSGSDPRIIYAPGVDRSRLPAVMASHDALVIPSLCLETGPLVALEAQALGLQVIGSRLGGIAENLAHDPGAMLVEPGNVAAWQAAFQQLADQRRSDDVRPNRPAPRTMADVAQDMAELYRELAA